MLTKILQCNRAHCQTLSAVFRDIDPLSLATAIVVAEKRAVGQRLSNGCHRRLSTKNLVGRCRL